MASLIALTAPQHINTHFKVVKAGKSAPDKATHVCSLVETASSQASTPPTPPTVATASVTVGERCCILWPSLWRWEKVSSRLDVKALAVAVRWMDTLADVSLRVQTHIAPVDAATVHQVKVKARRWFTRIWEMHPREACGWSSLWAKPETMAAVEGGVAAACLQLALMTTVGITISWESLAKKLVQPQHKHPVACGILEVELSNLTVAFAHHFAEHLLAPRVVNV